MDLKNDLSPFFRTGSNTIRLKSHVILFRQIKLESAFFDLAPTLLVSNSVPFYSARWRLRPLFPIWECYNLSQLLRSTSLRAKTLSRNFFAVHFFTSTVYLTYFRSIHQNGDINWIYVSVRCVNLFYNTIFYTKNMKNTNLNYFNSSY